MASCEKIYLTEEEYFEFKKWLPTTSRKFKKQLTSLTHWDVKVRYGQGFIGHIVKALAGDCVSAIFQC